jgi:hypothetical protein
MSSAQFIETKGLRHARMCCIFNKMRTAWQRIENKGRRSKNLNSEVCDRFEADGLHGR